MRRRRPAGQEYPIPAELLTYRGADWPIGCHPECAFWEAVDQFMDAHPEAEFPIPVDGPDVPFHAERGA